MQNSPAFGLSWEVRHKAERRQLDDPLPRARRTINGMVLGCQNPDGSWGIRG